MAVRAFVARSGWNKTPISAQEWREAASTLPDLELHAGVGGEPVRAMLRGSRRRGVALQQGYLCGDYVDGRLAAVMFSLADRLGAQVFSETRQPYRDVDDWQSRNAERLNRRHRRPQHAAASRALAGPAGTGETAWLPVFVAGVLSCLLVMWALQ